MRYIKAELVTPAYSYTVRYVTDFFTGTGISHKVPDQKKRIAQNIYPIKHG